eukprot:1696948-Rhodomonas_salina.1
MLRHDRVGFWPVKAAPQAPRPHTLLDPSRPFSTLLDLSRPSRLFEPYRHCSTLVVFSTPLDPSRPLTLLTLLTLLPYATPQPPRPSYLPNPQPSTPAQPLHKRSSLPPGRGRQLPHRRARSRAARPAP